MMKAAVQYKIIRVAKEQSAFVYDILESYEGITSYSTLDYDVHATYRDIELQTPVDFVPEVDELLIALGGTDSSIFWRGVF